jgi:alpha-tubulin suppressor-like RCC1 family protein
MKHSRAIQILAHALAKGVCLGVTSASLAQGQVVGWGSNVFGELRLATESLLPITMVSGGTAFSVGLRADGTVSCWGSNVLGQCSPPQDLGPLRQVDAGLDHAVAIKIDGSVVCWGDDQWGQCAVPTGIIDARSVSGGGKHTLAAQSNGVVWAWGLNSSGQCDVPMQPGLGFVTQVSAGIVHSMALRSDGTVVCWGSNAENQCAVPPGLAGVSQISAGGDFSAALRLDGTIAVWGALTAVPAGFAACSRIDAGESHVMALGTDGKVRCFGANSDGQCTIPAELQGSAMAIAAGSSHSLAVLADGSVLGWGLNNSLQCDPPEAMRRAEHVSAGRNFSVVVNTLDRVRAWGDNKWGQSAPPRGLGTVVEVSAGYQHALALNSQGTVFAWGANADNYNVAHNQSTVPTGLGPCNAIAAGWFHSIAIRSDGSVVCWGAGQVDTGTNRNHGQSIVPSPLTNVVAVSGGALHTMALKQNGVVRCWGEGTTGTGNPDYGQSIVPGDLPSAQAIAAGGYHSVALLDDGTVRCWGWNDLGQSTVPAGLSGVEQIAAGWTHTAALLADGSVRCWGSNDSGQCAVPPGLGPVATIACGIEHTLVRLKVEPSGCNNPSGDGTATVAISGSSWQDVPTWSWTDGGGPQAPGSLTNVDLGRYGSVGSECDAQCGTFLARSGSTLIVPIDLSTPLAAQPDRSITVEDAATMAGRILLLAEGAQRLPVDLNVAVLRSPKPLGTFDIIRSTLPAPDGWFLTLVPSTEPSGYTLYSLRMLKLQTKPRGAQAQGAFVGGQVIAAEAMDYDGNGFDDLAVAIDFGSTLPGRLQVLLNDGQGNLGQTSVQTNTLPSPTCLAVGDLSRDGKPDAVVGSASQPVVQTFLNAYPPPPAGAPPFTAGPDLVVVGGTPVSAVILPRIVALLGDVEAEVVVGTDSGSGDGGTVDVYSDLSGDGIPETQTQAVQVPTTPTTTTSRGRRVATGGASSTTLGGTEAAGRIVVLTRGGAQGGYQINQQIDVPGAPVSMLFRDIDRDGAAEIVSANAHPQPQGSGSALPVLTIFRGTDTTPGQPGGEVYGDAIPVAPAGSSEGLDVDLLDADGDGDRDVVCVVGTTSIDSSASLIRIDTQAGVPGGPITIGEETVLSTDDPVLCVRANLDGVDGEDVALVEADAGGLSFTASSAARPVLLRAALPCRADLDFDRDVDGADLGILLVGWGAGGLGDLTGDGLIDGADLGALLVAWGPCPE